jgi:hypothetical protein
MKMIWRGIKPATKQTLGGAALLVAVFLIFGLIQFQIDRLHFVNMTWWEWLSRQFSR